MMAAGTKREGIDSVGDAVGASVGLDVRTSFGVAVVEVLLDRDRPGCFDVCTRRDYLELGDYLPALISSCVWRAVTEARNAQTLPSDGR